MPSNRNVSVDIEHTAVRDVVVYFWDVKRVASNEVERRIADAEVAGVD